MPEFVDASGISIIYDVFPAVGTPRGVLQLNHGLGEHSGRYGALIEALTGDGWIVYADDHRGHGRTGLRQWDGDASKLGHLGPGGLRAAEAAVWQFTQLIHGEHPTLPLVIFGQSWGSMLAQKMLAQHPEAYDAVVLSATARLMPGDLNAFPLNARWKGPNAHGNEWLSVRPEIWDEFRNDPLVTEEPLARLFGIRDGLRIFQRVPKHLSHDVPVLLMVGEDDPLGGPRSVHRLAADYRDRAGLTDVTVRVYEGDRHEIFNEPDAPRVRADLLDWLERRFPRSS